MKLVKKCLEARWFHYEDEDGKVSFQVRPFPLSRAVSMRGEFDVIKTAKEKFVYGIVAWEGLEDEDGKPLPCTDEAKGKIFDYALLPDKVYTFVHESLAKVEEEAELEDAVKNP